MKQELESLLKAIRDYSSSDEIHKAKVMQAASAILRELADECHNSAIRNFAYSCPRVDMGCLNLPSNMTKAQVLLAHFSSVEES